GGHGHAYCRTRRLVEFCNATLRRALCWPAAPSRCSCSCRSHHCLPHRAALPSRPGSRSVSFWFTAVPVLRSVYFRRSTINLSVRLLCLVFLPSVGHPQGVCGCLSLTRPSPPPSGCS